MTFPSLPLPELPNIWLCTKILSKERMFLSNTNLLESYIEHFIHSACIVYNFNLFLAQNTLINL